MWGADTRLPPPEAWSDRPLLLRADSRVHESSATQLRLGTAFRLRSALFQGQAVVQVSGASETDDRQYFRGRQRRMCFVVKGRFLRRIPCDDVVCGQEFERPLGRLPPELLLRPVIAALQWMCPQIRMDIHAQRPYLMTPICGTAQQMRVDVPASKVSGADSYTKEEIFARCEEEDCTRMADSQDCCISEATGDGAGDHNIGSQSRTANERKAFFNRCFAEALERPGEELSEACGGERTQLCFEPELEYTFHFYSHVLDMATMRAFGFDVAPVLNQQPMVVRRSCPAALRLVPPSPTAECVGNARS